MSRTPEDRLDSLLAEHFRREATQVDAQAMLERVRHAIPVPRRRRFLPRLAWGLATAAAVVVAFFTGVSTTGPQLATAETLLREAKVAAALPIDRCYLVQSEPHPHSPIFGLPFAQPREMRLWTRGKSFYLELVNTDWRWAWGRDETGGIWLAIGKNTGILYEADEVPEPLNLTADLYSMNVNQLLDEVLSGFNLTREPGETLSTYRIRISPRDEQEIHWLRSATLEVDAATRVIRRMVLQRVFRGRPLANVTFTLIETRAQADSVYQLEGHLKNGSPIYSRTYAPQRRAMLMKPFLARTFGPPPVGR